MIGLSIGLFVGFCQQSTFFNRITPAIVRSVCHIFSLETIAIKSYQNVLYIRKSAKSTPTNHEIPSSFESLLFIGYFLFEYFFKSHLAFLNSRKSCWLIINTNTEAKKKPFAESNVPHLQEWVRSSLGKKDKSFSCHRAW